jgi:hypothetical protein
VQHEDQDGRGCGGSWLGPGRVVGATLLWCEGCEEDILASIGLWQWEETERR